MPIGLGIPLEFTVNGIYKNQAVAIVGWYRTVGASWATVEPIAAGEAFWNHIKDAWRALHLPNGIDRTVSVFVSESGALGAYAEYAVPVGEQLGTRTPPAGASFAPGFVAGGFRLTVGTRQTRPGQKRVWGLLDQDVGDGDELTPAYAALLDTFASVWASEMLLGAPVAGGSLEPLVTRVTSPGNVVVRENLVTGYYVHPNATSQVSRKIGSGA